MGEDDTSYIQHHTTSMMKIGMFNGREKWGFGPGTTQLKNVLQKRVRHQSDKWLDIVLVKFDMRFIYVCVQWHCQIG